MTSTILWLLLLDAAVSVRSRCLAFRMASRALAQNNRLMGRPHQKPPFMLFATLRAPQLITHLKDIYRKLPCLFDFFTKDFMDQWDIASTSARAVLHLLTITAWVETAGVETMHAWFRRLAVFCAVSWVSLRVFLVVGCRGLSVALCVVFLSFSLSLSLSLPRFAACPLFSSFRGGGPL